MKLKHLKLYCSSLDEQKHFYTKKLKFELAEEGEEEITLGVGDSLLTFSENRLKKSYYHFALNIPYQLVDSALGWASKKVELLSYEGEILQDFASWKAKAFYFFDPAGNIVEFIGRERIKSEEKGSFNEKKVLGISEIGLPVAEVSAVSDTLEKIGVEKFDCNSNTFCAMGTDEGLFIIVDQEEKHWFPTDEPARPFPLEVNFEVGGTDFNLTSEAGKLDISAA